MKILSTLILALIFGFTTLAATAAGDVEKGNTQQTTISTANPADILLAPWDDKEAMMKRGEEIYKEKCIVCHQADGNGLPGAFPPLAKSDYLLKDPVRGVAQTLNGSHEEMIVNGVTYNMPMTPQVDTKEDAVAVINYVLKNFGNDAELVTMDDVKEVKVNPR